MPNVMFKRGLHQNLPTENILDGAFYLTTDTNRLYTGINKGTSENPRVELVELNQSITVVPDLNTLYDITYDEVKPGQFYYVQGVGDYSHQPTNTYGGNILAVCIGESQQKPGFPEWVQVNPDTNTNTDINDNTFVIGNTNADGTAAAPQDMIDMSGTGVDTGDHKTRFIYRGITNNVAKYELVIEQKSTHKSSVQNGTDTYEKDVIARLDLDLDTLVASASQVGVTGSISTTGTTTKMTVAADGTGASTTQKLDITAGSNIQFTGTKDNLTVSATDTKYDLTSPAGQNQIILKPQNDNNESNWDKISITGGTNIAVDGATADSLIIKHNTSGATAGTYGGNASPANTNPSAGGNFIVPEVTIDAQGHITAISDKTITLPQAANDQVTAVAANNLGNIVVSQNGRTDVTSAAVANPNYVSAETDPDGDHRETVGPLFYRIGQADENGNVTEITVVNQGNLGDYYTKNAIDKIIQGLDALTYKGTVGQVDGATVATLPEHPSNGDTYKVVKKGNYGNNNNCEVGDLLIATGIEGNDGTITSPVWTLVASGNDTDTQYQFTVDGTTLKYAVVTNGTPGTPQSYATITGDEELSSSGSGTTITVKHNKVLGNNAGTSKGLDQDRTPGASGTFKVPYITVNDYGHITAIDEHTVTLPAADVGYILTQDNENSNPAKVILKHGNGDVGDVTFIAGTRTSVTAVGGATKTIAFNHTAPTAHTANNSDSVAGANSGANLTPAHGTGTFVIPEIYYDNLGHITGHENRTITLPQDNNTTYTLGTITENDTYKIKLTAGGSGGSSSDISINSSTLNISTGGSGNATTMTVDLVWGAF